MSELLGWAIIVGLAIAIAGIVMLSSQIEQNTRRTLEVMIQNNELLLAQLGEDARNAAPAGDTMATLVLERRRGARRNGAARLAPFAGERRVRADRRSGGIGALP
ncbi:MAG: hypothetical protein IT529_22675 [Burkholderiales bacterium]|nr:hypothetical protein [Burkholderiales bacterium]